MIKTNRIIQICSSLCLFMIKPTLLCVAFLLPTVVFTYFLSFGFSPFVVAFPVLLLSTIFLVTITTKKKVILIKNAVQKENLTASPENLLEEKLQLVFKNGTIFDGPVSEDDDGEEDGLIEIAITDSEIMDLKEEKKETRDSNLLDILPLSMFKQPGLMELLAEINEVNEEDDLIEIDISMGSIKCSRFELEI
ncbi:hypothetical protein CFOL_v3_12309 [Cephalotus follicularis]|uniref:Transmembrane protein n=1 Tax=Cephalotus follicularis TaxID=3775 RepID=A0A1Q3BLA2_CEPFO|nr:hypothetical protein CFOL_v3_12309 [Cephalotus follicularis]